MTTENNTAVAEAQIRELMDKQAEAVRAKDMRGALAAYAPDILSFDVVNPLQYVGVEAVRERLEAWFSQFRGPIGFEHRGLGITAGADVAFCHSLNRVSATRTDGQKLEMWWRATVCFRKIDNQWMITHEHTSVPFDGNSGLASLNLTP
jgi:uncharacterized protein (TIGR02246 family)